MSQDFASPSLALLKEIHLLSTMGDGELGRLLQHGAVYKREAHSNIIIEGEFTWGLYLLLNGTVGVFRNNKLTGMSYDVGQINGPGFFGEMSLVDDNPRSATVKALTDCIVFHITKENFLRFLASSPGLNLRFYEAVVKNLMERLRELDDSYVVSQYQLWKIALRKEAS